MRQKRSDRDRELNASFARRLANIEDLIAERMGYLDCPEGTVRRLSDGTSTTCGRRSSVITIQDDGIVWHCSRCAQFYVGDTRDIDSADRVEIELYRLRSEKGN